MNEPAFPSNITVNTQYMKAGLHAGMTLRDYFAGQAIIGVCVNTKDVAELDNLTTSECIAKLSYRIADAMLREREK